MSSAAFRAQSASDAALPHVAFKAARTLLAIGVTATAIFAQSNAGTLALAAFDGAPVLGGHGVVMHLGNETLAAAGTPTGGVGWLGATAVAALSSAGTKLTAFVAALVALGTFMLVERRARRVGGSLLGLAAALLAALCAIGSFGFAGGMMTALFTVALAELLDAPGKRAAVCGTALAIVWCNVAPQGVFAPALALLFALGARFEARPEAEQRMRWYAFAGTAAALLATPAFFTYPAFAFSALRLDRSLEGVVQFNPVEVAALAYRIGFPLALFAAFAVGIPRKRVGDVMLFLAVALLALANGAYLVVFGVLVAPLLAASGAASLRLPEMKTAAVRSDVMIAIAAVLGAAVLVTTIVPRDRAVPAAYGLAAGMASDAQPHRLFCNNVEWCDAALVPGSKTRVLADGRIDVYPEAIRTAERDTIEMHGTWRKALERYRIDAMLVRKGRSLSQLMSLTPGWKLVASDDVAALYERPAQP